MRKLLTISLLSLAAALSSNAQANIQASTASGSFSQSFVFTTATPVGELNPDNWFRFWVTAQASEFKSFNYTISGGDLKGSFSGTINAIGNIFTTGFLDKIDGVQDFSSGQTYTLTLGGETLSSGNKAFAVTSNGIITAVPEPESYAMLLAGLGVMATIARRRNRPL